VNTPTQPLVTRAHLVDTNAQLVAIETAIAKYSPEAPDRLWNGEVQEFTRTAITDFGPINTAEARKAMNVVAHLAMWTRHVACQPLTRNVVFGGQHIDAYITHATAGKSADRRRLIRLRVLRIASELHNFDPERRERRRKLGPTTRVGGFSPYTPAEIIRFRNQGATRSTAHRRHNWMVILSLAAGCALSVTEIVYLRNEDIELGDGFVRVHVQGERSRTVICRAEWEDDIRAFMSAPNTGEFPLVVDYVAEHAGQGDPETGRPKTPSKFIETLIKKAADDIRGRFSVERLRSTWIVQHMDERTHPVALIGALGDKGFSTLARLMPYVRELDEDELIAMFRGAVPR
jgi:integrase